MVNINGLRMVGTYYYTKCHPSEMYVQITSKHSIDSFDLKEIGNPFSQCLTYGMHS